MALGNSLTTYGTITRTFHWITALLILTAIPLGMIGTDLSHQIKQAQGSVDQDLIDRTVLVFSLHKTIGITAFFVAITRILWAFTQPKPALLNGNHRLEAFLAELVHWLLYGSMLLVPLSGWITHAASSGGAPIWLPVGQDLFFIPKSETIAGAAGAAHHIGKNILILAILLHIAGALKHHFVDRDSTLRRMLTGDNSAQPSQEQPNHLIPALVALAIIAFAYGSTIVGTLSARADNQDAAHQGQSQQTTNTPDATSWQTESGSIKLEVSQMGSAVNGEFTQWQAEIHYTPGPDGKRGDIEVTIPVTSLQLGSVSDQAMTADYFNAADYPSATVMADLIQVGETLSADGHLTIKDHSVPVSFPVDLKIDDDRATATGDIMLDRRDFEIGKGVEEGSLGFEVQVVFEITATKS